MIRKLQTHGASEQMLEVPRMNIWRAWVSAFLCGDEDEMVTRSSRNSIAKDGFELGRVMEAISRCRQAPRLLTRPR
jgi:hypothetical protein